MISILKRYLNHRFLFASVLIVFALIYSSISLVNHYNYRTSAYDLGINNNAIYDYAHFRWNDCMLLQPQYKNILSDHFSLYPVLVSPLYWILGSYTMLIFQIVAILFGGIGIYKLIEDKSKDPQLALIAMCHFFLMWGIYSALAFDYHDNVIAAMFVPWLIYYFLRQQTFATWTFLILILISKENMALWSIFIGLGLFLYSYDNKKLRVTALLLSLASLLYFIVILKFVIPSLANAGRIYNHFNYSALGSNFEEAIINIFTRPLEVFGLLFSSPNGNDYLYGIKVETHLMVFLCGGYALLKRPSFLVMLIPIYAQKMFNDDQAKWGTICHYSIEFAPIITIAFYLWIVSYSIETRKVLATFGLSLCLISIFLLIQERSSKWFNKDEFHMYEARHYETSYNVSEINEALKLIPDTAKVSAEANIVPHLSFRDYIYHYPYIADADYIVLLDDWRCSPISQEEFQSNLKALLVSTEWHSLYAKNGFYIFKR